MSSRFPPKNARQREMERLIRYAQGMSAKVQIRPYRSKADGLAAWDLFTDNSVTITIYRKKGMSDLEIVLSMIHELGHHRDFIALNRRDIGEPDAGRGLTKEQRKQVYDYELRGMRYWKQIYHDTDCRFPIWRLFQQMELDIAAYHHYYLHGKDWTKREARKLAKEIRQKHREGFEPEEDVDELADSYWDEETDTEKTVVEELTDERGN